MLQQWEKMFNDSLKIPLKCGSVATSGSFDGLVVQRTHLNHI